MKHVLQNPETFLFPIGVIASKCSSNAADVVKRRHSLDCGSPIEELFFFALAMETLFRECGLVSALPGDRIEHQPNPAGLYVERQVEAFGWRVDFLFYRGGKVLVVECDGHDFHERSKEQAARDRSRDRDVQSNGATIFRFTGSELYRDPCKCVDAVVAWATSK